MTDETKLCPYCGEEIKRIAIKCKHCGSMLVEGTPAPATVLPGGSATGAQPVPPWWSMSGPLAVGTQVREFRIEALLGQGGMGEVYRAEDTATGRAVAIKVVAPELTKDQGVRRRFMEEARVMAGLDHPGIVSLYSFFEEGGRFFLVMRLVDGRTLDQVLQERRLDEPEAVRVSAAVAAALHYAHTRPQPVVHRDIKPANIMLARDGAVVVTDFGVAKALGREKLTRTRGMVGTYEYMSPEQVRGEEVTPASDLYSLGVTLYRMLTGVVPFPQRSDTGLECMNAHLHETPPPLAEFRDGVSPALEAVVRRALAKNAGERFLTADHLRHALGETAAPRPGPYVPTPARPPLPAPAPASPARSAFAPPSAAPARGRLDAAVRAWSPRLAVSMRVVGVLAILGFVVPWGWLPEEEFDVHLRDHMARPHFQPGPLIWSWQADRCLRGLEGSVRAMGEDLVQYERSSKVRFMPGVIQALRDFETAPLPSPYLLLLLGIILLAGSFLGRLHPWIPVVDAGLVAVACMALGAWVLSPAPVIRFPWPHSWDVRMTLYGVLLLGAAGLLLAGRVRPGPVLPLLVLAGLGLMTWSLVMDYPDGLHTSSEWKTRVVLEYEQLRDGMGSLDTARLDDAEQRFRLQRLVAAGLELLVNVTMGLLGIVALFLGLLSGSEVRRRGEVPAGWKDFGVLLFRFSLASLVLLSLPPLAGTFLALGMVWVGGIFVLILIVASVAWLLRLLTLPLVDRLPPPGPPRPA